jgi:exodeoxyribonuclease V beta subunit
VSHSTPTLDAQPFDLTGPLPTGVTVLEASAGTGKTYTIAALTARFVADGTRLDQLLLVTFTRIATSELRERVRERLVLTEAQLARVVAGAPPSHIDEVIALLGSDPLDVVQERRRRLADAIANFDSATIETTHGFCQKVLDRLGTLADSEPGIEFVDNVDELAREVIDDLYLRRFYRQRDGLTMSRDQAGQIARIAIENPAAEVHPTEARQGSAEAMRRGLALAVRAELEARKRSYSLMTHDDQLTRLLATLTGPNGDAAVESLHARYKVVLIDEFQDTDPIQWRIVERAFGGGQTALVLIGDPKQAIYAFRGADVYAYLDAAQTAGARATLSINRRSDQALLDGLDALFDGARLGHPGIVYRDVRAAPTHQLPRLHGAPSEKALRVRVLDAGEPALELTNSGYPQAGSAREFVARDVASEVVAMLNSAAEIETRDDEGRTRSMAPIAPGHLAVLVRTHRNAALIQAELEHVGVPAVIGGSGSVFTTPAAADWLALLEALEQPSHPARARAAALTPLIGWSATALAQATEADLEALHQQLHARARTLREHGISSLTESVLAGGNSAARLLALVGGERRLTDLQHVAQLLGASAGETQLGVAALTAWMRQRIAAAETEGSSDERTRRLDSDADAVQILTFHRSKGLEFPIVFCPYLWEPGRLAQEGSPVYFHDENGERSIDVGLSGDGYDSHLLSHNIEERGEDLRLAYVALTRARHQATIWWASAWTAKDSPLGRLLFAKRDDGSVDWQGGRRPREDDALHRFGEIAALAPDAISVEPARPMLSARFNPPADSDTGLERARFTRTLDTSWRRTSYTALTAVVHDAVIASEPEESVIADEPEAVADAVASELPLSVMASGPRLGTLIHQALQELDFDQADLAAAISGWLTQATANRPELLGGPAAEVANGLALALATPLGGELDSLALSGVARVDRLDELNFELPLAGGDQPLAAARLAQVGELLTRFLDPDDPVAPYASRLADPAMAAVLRGYLTGSIDLVLRVHGEDGRDRYAIIDYKTNWLGAPGEPLSLARYTQAALTTEMQRTHYMLQALLYSVALHRFLRWRLADYDPKRDLLGVRYLFLRGMLGPGAPETGIFSWRVPAGLVVALSDLLAGSDPIAGSGTP